jgi:hypothetical protein
LNLASTTLTLPASQPITAIELGHASDTTIARAAAGIATVEGRVMECSLFGVKSADQTKINDVVMANDADMTVSLTTGTWKVFIMAIYANLNSSSQPQGKIVFSGTYTTAAGTLEMGSHSTAGIRGSYPNNTDADLFTPTFATTTQNAWFFVEGVIVATGAGTCAWRWSQFASSANSITLKKGSALIATKLA